MGIDINRSEEAYDVVLYSEFSDSEGLDAYQKLVPVVFAVFSIRKLVESIGLIFPLILSVIFYYSFEVWTEIVDKN